MSRKVPSIKSKNQSQDELQNEQHRRNNSKLPTESLEAKIKRLLYSDSNPKSRSKSKQTSSKNLIQHQSQIQQGNVIPSLIDSFPQQIPNSQEPDYFPQLEPQYSEDSVFGIQSYYKTPHYKKLLQPCDGKSQPCLNFDPDWWLDLSDFQSMNGSDSQSMDESELNKSYSFVSEDSIFNNDSFEKQFSNKYYEYADFSMDDSNINDNSVQLHRGSIFTNELLNIGDQNQYLEIPDIDSKHRFSTPQQNDMFMNVTTIQNHIQPLKSFLSVYRSYPKLPLSYLIMPSILPQLGNPQQFNSIYNITRKLLSSIAMMPTRLFSKYPQVNTIMQNNQKTRDKYGEILKGQNDRMSKLEKDEDMLEMIIEKEEERWRKLDDMQIEIEIELETMEEVLEKEKEQGDRVEKWAEEMGIWDRNSGKVIIERKQKGISKYMGECQEEEDLQERSVGKGIRKSQ